MRFKNVLFVGPSYKRKGGIASVLLQYKNNIEDFNFYPSILWQNKWLNMLIYPIRILLFLPFMLFNKKIEIVHIHSSTRTSFLRKYVFFVLSKYLFKKKMVFHIHSGEFHNFYNNTNSVAKKLVRNVFDEADSIVVLSKEWKEYYTKRFKDAKITIINNIIPYQEPIKKDFNDKLVVIYLGLIDEKKGIFDLVEAIGQNRNLFKEKMELIIGGIGKSDQLVERIDKYKLNEIIEYKGWITGEAKKELLEKAHIMILPSFFEGLPISLLEALSFSTPIIATKVGGIPQILTENKNGKYIVPGDLISIKNALLHYINSPGLIHRQSEASYKISKDYFPDQVLAGLLDIYKNLSL